MNDTPETTKKQNPKINLITILTLISFVALLLGIFWPARSSSRKLAIRLVCATNLKGLYGAMDIYAQDNNDVYPMAQNWCDLLLTHTKITRTSFLCKRSDAIEGRSSYAMNPNCEPNSPGDIVLLFETKAGWNQHGGPELLTTENHKGKSCNILFNNGTVEFVRPDGLDKLKWQ